MSTTEPSSSQRQRVPAFLPAHGGERITIVRPRTASAGTHSTPPTRTEGPGVHRDRIAAARDRDAAARDRRQAAEYLNQVRRDGLTGALQREAGRIRLAAELARARAAGWSLVVAFVDVDLLKRTNDAEGHAAGDRLLRAVGESLFGGLASSDVVVRHGGDEFVCALPRTQPDEASRRFEDASALLTRMRPGASFTVGLTLCRPDDTLDTVLERADQMLYRERDRRRGQSWSESC